MSSKADLAEEYYKQGYNCSQAVLLAFADEIPISFEEAAKTSSSFGGGMGYLREVCGAVSGMFMAAGLLYGCDEPDKQKKNAHYKLIRQLGEEFRSEYGSIVCRDILALRADKENQKHECTCLDCVKSAADIMEREIEARG